MVSMFFILATVASLWTSSSVSAFAPSSLSVNHNNHHNSMALHAEKKVAVIAGATGYIGKSTVRESINQGYETYALVRDLKKVNSAEGKALYGDYFEGAML